MFEYSVITPVKEKEQAFYIIPLADEERYVDMNCESGAYEYARLDLMLEILNGYQAMPAHAAAFETEHYHYTRSSLEKGMLAKVVSRKAVGSV